MVQRIVKIQFVSLVIHQVVYQLFPERYTRDCYIVCKRAGKMKHRIRDLGFIFCLSASGRSVYT